MIYTLASIFIGEVDQTIDFGDDPSQISLMLHPRGGLFLHVSTHLICVQQYMF